MSLLYSEQRENAFLLLLIGVLSIGLALFAGRLATFMVPEAQLVDTDKKAVTFVLAPELKPAPKPELKPAIKPEPKPATKPEPKPATKPKPKPASTNNAQSTRSKTENDAQSLNSMFNSSLGGSSDVVVAGPSNLTSPEVKKTQQSASGNHEQTYQVESQQAVDQALAQAHSVTSTTQAQNRNTSDSALLNREIASESGRVEQDIAGLFNDANRELRRIVMAYGLRKQALRVTLHFTQGLIDKVSINGVPQQFERELQALLVGQRIATVYTGTKSHVLVVNKLK